MPEKTSYLQVNWVDGMKINKNHFISQEHSVSDRIKDVRQSGINLYNYGLLPSAGGDKEAPVKIVIYLDNQHTLRVKVFECNAISPGGGRINISESIDLLGFAIPLPETVYEVTQIKQEDLYISLSVNHFKQTPVGVIDPTEEPPRHPYTVPECKVHLIPESQLGKKESGLNFILIGKVHISESGTELVKEYIPPCTSILSHPKLVTIHTEFDKFFSQLEVDIVTIIKKIREKEQTNSLATTLESIAEPLLYFLSTNILGFRWNIPMLPPLHMCEKIAQSARIIKNALDANSGKAKEELLNYFTEWCTLNQGDFETIIFRTVNFEYQHSNMHKTLATMMQFAEVISALFSKLSTLEYIGKKKETSIFVKEQTVKKSFLAD
ncbi:MAG: hypothetical protein NTV01_01690 [Bacteroidia bacterium]|nr:hypothetical protein [Bacteroidia bacterium]